MLKNVFLIASETVSSCCSAKVIKKKAVQGDRHSTIQILFNEHSNLSTIITCFDDLIFVF